MSFRRFEEISAWQTARRLAKIAYSISKTGQFARDFALRDQMRNSAISIMANIAEGYARRSDKSFIQFLRIAKGSAIELQSHLYVAADQDYLTQESFTSARDLADYCARQLSNLIRHLTDRVRQSSGP